MGTLAALAWIFIVMIGSAGFTHIEPHGWVIFLIGVPMCFGLEFGAIWAIDWVISGFREGRT
jgi:hypothetical protein